MSGKHTIALLGLCTASLTGFVAFGSWWSTGGFDAASWRPPTETNLAMLENKVRSEPASVANFTRLGEAYKMSGRLTEAVSAYVSAAELAPRDHDVQRALVSLKAMAEAKGRH